MIRSSTRNQSKVALVVRGWNSTSRLKTLWADFKIANKNSTVEFEFFIFDDASNDGSQSRLQKEFPDATVLTSGDRIEYAASLNRAAISAIGDGADYLFFCNADCDGFSDGFLDVLVGYAKSNSLQWVSPTVFDFSGKNLSQLRRNSHFGVPFNVQTEAHLIESKAFSELGGFNENLVRYGEDIELMNRFLATDRKSGTSERAWLRHEGSGLSSRQIFVRTHFMIRNALVLQSHLSPTKNTDGNRWVRGVLTFSHLRSARPIWYAVLLWAVGIATGLGAGLFASRSSKSFLSTNFQGNPSIRNLLLRLDLPLEKFATSKGSKGNPTKGTTKLPRTRFQISSDRMKF